MLCSVCTFSGVVSMSNPKHLKNFSYSLRQAYDGSFYIQFDIRSQNQKSKIGLIPGDTLELWITYAEMPSVLADLVDERTWDAHRKYVLEMLSKHFIKV